MPSDCNSQQSGEPFNLEAFAAREHRRVQRLVRACYGVGHTHPWFMNLSRRQQEYKVREWVENSLKARDIRLGHITEPWELPVGFWGATYLTRHGIPRGLT
jgi:hypothetical protein